MLVHDQVRVASSGDIIGLDYGAVLDVVKFYVADSDVKRIFENVIMCGQIEQEFSKENE